MLKPKIFLFGSATESQNRKSDSVEEELTQPSIGLLYLDAILKKNNYEVLTRDYTYWTDEHFLEEIKKNLNEFHPDIVGISINSMTRISAYKAIKLIKEWKSDVKIIVGGIHAAILYEQLLNNFPIDTIVIGEAEETFIELLNAISNKKNLKEIKGIAYKENGKVIKTPERELLKNLDSLPFPSYDTFMSPKIKSVYILSSRRCPNNCSFCCLAVVSKQRWRFRSPKNVVDEIEFIVKNYPWVESIEFADDTSTLDNKRMIEICKELINRGIKRKFVCQGRIKPVSREMFYWMEKAGFVRIGFGIETGAKKLLESIHKGITKEDCFNTFNILKEFKKIEVTKNLIVGFPGETEETVNETIEFTKELQKIIKMDYFYAFPLWVYPGTEVYQIGKSKGWIDDSYWLTDKPCPNFTLEHPMEWLIKMSNKISIETSIAQGKIFFIKKILEKIITHPKYYIRRALRLSK
jgi:anaerobic magnesium-protoporphyrin IX monomethyl ester cyclase